MKNIVIMITILLSIALSYGQNNLPTIKTNKKFLDIKENGKLDKDAWEVVKVTPFDLYEVNNKNTKQHITLYSEIDSLQFDIEPNKNYDFVILLNGKEKFQCRITSKYNNYRKDCKGCKITSDSIPFKLGRDNRIAIEGKINDGEVLKFLFDTGAESNWLYNSGAKKYKNLKYTSDGVVVGQGGETAIKNSYGNSLSLSNLIWDNKHIYYGGQDLHNYDGGIGYKIFEGKVLEINYDNSLLIAHNVLPKNINGYTKHNFKQIWGLYFIELTIIINGKEKTAWFDFDTGNTGALSYGSQFVNDNPELNKLEKLGEGNTAGVGTLKVKSDIVSIPLLKIGGVEIFNSPAFLYKNSTLPFNICGNDILKRFNMIIDFRNDAIYLKKNNLFDTPFKKKEHNVMKYIIVFSVISLLLAFIFFFYKRRKAII